MQLGGSGKFSELGVPIIIIISAYIYGLYTGFQGSRLPMAFYGWAAVTASALISTALGMVLFFAGLRRINTSNAAIISTFEIVVTASLAVAILGEALSTQQVVGACLVISAVAILAKSEFATHQAIVDRKSLR